MVYLENAECSKGLKAAEAVQQSWQVGGDWTVEQRAQA